MTLSKKLSIDDIYEALCRTCDALEKLGAGYFLAGGTLLGAWRSGDLIPHDIDFDLDCLLEDERLILAGQEVFTQFGLTVRKKMSVAAERLLSQERTKEPLYSSCLNVEYMGVVVGDIHVYTIFEDGIARRFDMASGMYANAKMSIPAWYYSGNEVLSIRGRAFRSVRKPELVLEKVYGPDWRTPLKPGQFVEGRNTSSGSVPDADIERLAAHALENGWTGKQDGAPQWPQEIKWVGWPAAVTREWIFRHEPLIHDGIASLLGSQSTTNVLSSGDVDRIQAFLRIMAAKAIQSERKRWPEVKGDPTTSRSWSKWLLRAIPIPRPWKAAIKTFHASIFSKKG